MNRGMIYRGGGGRRGRRHAVAVQAAQARQLGRRAEGHDARHERVARLVHGARATAHAAVELVRRPRRQDATETGK